MYGANLKTQFSNTIYPGQAVVCLTSPAIMGVQMGEMSKLG
jgi:hypothetical protein